MENKEKLLNIYDIVISITGFEEITDKLYSDFKFFQINKNTKKINLNINIVFDIPPYQQIPEISASMYKTDCICYDTNNIRYADYNGKALVIFNKKNKSAQIFSQDKDLLYEISYLFIHSQAGEMLDLKGFHRIHACAFSYNSSIFICMLPQGGGKSTLLLNLLKDKNIKLLSDDTPLIDRKGNIYPFPIRIGVCEDFDTTNIPNNFTTTFNRRKFGQKKLISFDFFKDRIETQKLDIKIILGKRIYSNKPLLQNKNSIFAFTELFKSCILGYGIPQILEFFILGGFNDFIKKSFIAFSRLIACISLLIRTKSFFYMFLSKDKEANNKYFLDFFKR